MAPTDPFGFAAEDPAGGDCAGVVGVCLGPFAHRQVGSGDGRLDLGRGGGDPDRDELF